MIKILLSLSCVTASGLLPHSETPAGLLLKEAVNLVHSLTMMKVVDTNEFPDQVHLLVDDITHEFGDEFDQVMGRLATKGHISLVSARSASKMWPLEPHFITPHPHASELESLMTSRHAKSELAERDFFDYAPHDVQYYTEPKCGGTFKEQISLDPGRCIEIEADGVKGAFIKNHSGYAMHVAGYQTPCCDPYSRVTYYWQKEYTNVCYNMRTGHALWWDWPGFNAP